MWELLLRSAPTLRYIEIMEFNESIRRQIMTETLMIEDRISLAALAKELGVDRNTVTRWADKGYCAQRLDSYRIGKKRYSSKQAAARFLALINTEPETLAAAKLRSGIGV
jgi:DNA-binding IclR family transcriptional regulator